MANINKIKLSGTTYNIEDLNAAKTVELTQAQYDALPSSAKTSNSLFIITDAQGADLSQYWTSAQTESAITQAVSGKQDTLSAGTGIDITDNVISATGGGGDLSGYVTTDTEQIISGRKIFTYASSGAKAIEFKQTDDTSKVGFTVRNSAETNNEVASFEFRPNTFTIDNVQHPLMYFGHYRNTKTANAGVPQTVIGFRQYDQKNGAAYHLLAPLPSDAKAPFSLTTSFQNFYMPLGIKVDNSTMVKADSGGVMDISSYIGGGGSITIDPSLDSGSTNAVSNSAVSAALNYNDMFLYRVDPVRTFDNHPTGTLQLRWRNPYNGSTATTQDAITFVKINNIPLIVDYASGINNLNLVESSAVTSAITSGSTDSEVPSSKAVYDKLGGLSIVKLTDTEYNALQNKDENTLYVVVSAATPTPSWVSYGAGDEVLAGSYSNLRIPSAVTFDDENSHFEIYLSNGNIAHIGRYCTETTCQEWNCDEYDEETRECIAQGDCISEYCSIVDEGYCINSSWAFDKDVDSLTHFTFGQDGYWYLNEGFTVEVTGDMQPQFAIEVLPNSI